MSSFDTELEPRELESVSSLCEEIVYRLPGCSDLMVRKTVQEVFRDFCRRTCALVDRIHVKVNKDFRAHTLSCRTSGCSPDCIVSVSVNGCEIDERFYSCDGGVFRLDRRFVPFGDEVADVDVEFACIPNIGSESAPQWFLRRYGDCIASGAVARLSAMTGRAWSDAQVAAIEMRAYENGLTEARTRHHSGGQMSSGKLNFINKKNIL